MDFSLFYFADSATAAAKDRYRLLAEGAKFADTHHFAAASTPERHFHEFGGSIPELGGHERRDCHDNPARRYTDGKRRGSVAPSGADRRRMVGRGQSIWREGEHLVRIGLACGRPCPATGQLRAPHRDTRRYGGNGSCLVVRGEGQVRGRNREAFTAQDGAALRVSRKLPLCSIRSSGTIETRSAK